MIGFVKCQQGFSSLCLFYGPLVLRSALLCRLGLDGAEVLVDAGVHPRVQLTLACVVASRTVICDCHKGY